jgi:lincosamide and streptogramin A transport system ATP-binding/permease protein
MSDIKINNLTFSYDTSHEEIFKDVTVTINTDWKLGFIGRNGKGKTTLFQLLLGRYPYSGNIDAKVKFEYFPFEVKDRSVSAREVARGIIGPFTTWEKEMEQLIEAGDEDSIEKYGEIQEEYEKMDGYIIDDMIDKELSLLKVDIEGLTRPFSTLSFGEQTKVLLGALFLKKEAFLLIDEPTNHLDQAGRQQLADYLEMKKGYILVSHDRLFIDECVDHILSINRKSIDVIKGNYSVWFQNKSLRDEYELEKNRKLKKDIRRMSEAKERTKDWSNQVEAGKIGQKVPDRGRIGHLAAKMMKRSKSLERRQDRSIDEKKELLQDLEEVKDLKMNPLVYEKEQLLELQDIGMSFEDKKILEHVNVSISRGDRIAITGGNGSGKSTLLKIVLGELHQTSGNIIRGSGLVISYINQDTGWMKGTVKEFTEKQGLNETIFMTVLRQLDFNREQLSRNIEELSQGQKKKALIASSLASQAHLYIWDEPLNYIDVISREQIEALLLKFKPALIFVEHDRLFIDRIKTKEIIL